MADVAVAFAVSLIGVAIVIAAITLIALVMSGNTRHTDAARAEHQRSRNFFG